MLECIAPEVWTAERPMRFLGLEMGTRMTLVRLASGGLWIHSPIALSAALRDAVDALGPVLAVVAPSLFHHLYVGEWMRAYPYASFSACPGLQEKRCDLAWTGVLGDEPEALWRGELEQVFFSARPLENEVVFFHRQSRSIVSSDFIFNLSTHASRLTRLAARVLGNGEPGVTLLERVLIRDRAAAREQVGRVAAWDAERIVLAHGDVIGSDGTAVLERAYRWL